MELYVDDMLIKSVCADLTNLAKTFAILKQYGMRLNSAKCTFEVESGKFLGFMVSYRVIKANLENILGIAQPRTKKEVQSLTSRVVALNQLISKATDRCLLFFKALKWSKKLIEWTLECASAYESLKSHIGQPPILSKLEKGDTLSRYLSVSPFAVSSVLT